MIISDWINVGSTIIIIFHSSLLWFIALPATHPIKIKLHAFRKGLLTSHWKYLSMAFIILLIFSLVWELTKSSPITRWSVFFISLLITSIFVQAVFSYILIVRERLQTQIKTAPVDTDRLNGPIDGGIW